MNQSQNPAGSPFDQKRPVPGVSRIIAVASGKGGVGKSTVATNLACALSGMGYEVGLLDADIYGPSLPRMFGALNQKPQLNEKQQLIPLIRHKLKLMSMGFLVEEGLAVVWRGPMLFKSMDQFLFGVEWGELDYLIVDLPPGTGDVQLTLAQKVPVTGALIVSTPQNVALADVKKAIDMFGRVNLPILGLAENMSYFQPPGSSERIDLFPRGELDAYLDSMKIKKLAAIPFETVVSSGGEIGLPVVISQPASHSAETFRNLAVNLVASIRND